MSNKESPQVYDVFLSHNSREKVIVERIADRLKRHALEPWFDKWCLTPGGDWQDELADGLRCSSACAIFIGPHGIGDWERLELKLATARMAKDRSFRVFLVLLPGLPEPFDTSSLPPFLSTRTWVDLRKGVAERRSFQTLINAIKGVASDPDISIAPRDEESPYQGLRPFDEQHEEFFFGRESDVQRLIEKLKSTRFLAVLGPSGSGKSSVLRAGLIPTLRKGMLPDSDTWAIRIFTPGARPLTSLAANLAHLYPQSSALKNLDELSSDERALNMATSVALVEHPPSECLVWFVDQFEEVFTLCRDETERRMFIANLLYAGTVPGGRNIVVLTIRADFYQKCALYPELSTQIATHQFLVSPLSSEGLRDAITEPAWRVGAEFEPGLVETILADVKSQPGALPLLEHALLELWNRRRGLMLTLEAYRETGGVEGAIAKRADTVFESFDGEKQAIVRRVMSRLTLLGEGTEDTRRRAPFNELVTRPDEADKVLEVVHAMTDARLLTATADLEGGPVIVDVSHEALIRGWPRLKNWIEENRQALRIHQQLTEAAQEWERSDRDEGLLLSASRLAQATEWRERNTEKLNESERNFLDASAELLTRVRLIAKRRMRRIIFGLVAALIIISTASIYAFHQNQLATIRGTEASAREIAAYALVELSKNPERGLLLAIEASRIARIAETENTLRQALSRSPQHALHVSSPNSVSNQTAKFWDAGNLVVMTNNKVLSIFDVENGKMLFERSYDLFVVNAVLSPDGQFVAVMLGTIPVGVDDPDLVIDSAGTVQICDARTGRDITKLQTSDAGPDLAFSPDNKFLLTPGDPSRVWEVGTWRLVTLIDGGLPTFSRDGSVLLTKSYNLGKLYVSDARNWKRVAEILTVAGGADGDTFGALSPDGRYVVSSTNDGRIRLHELETGRIAHEHHLKETARAVMAEFSSDGRYVAFAVGAKAMWWELATGKMRELSDMKKKLYDLSVSPDNRLMLTVDGSALLYELYDGSLLGDFHAVGSGSIGEAEFSADGRFFLTTNDDGSVFIGDLNYARARKVFDAAVNPEEISTNNAVFSSDHKLVATIAAKENGPDVAQVWELETGRIIKLPTRSPALTSIAFSPDNRLVLTTDVAAVQVWELATGRNISEFRHGDELLGAAYSPDGKMVVTTGKGMIKLWDAGTWRVIEEIPAQIDLTDRPAMFAPDGKRILFTASGQVRVWEIASKRILLQMGERRDDSGNPMAVYSPNGEYILTWEFLAGEFTASSVQVRDANTGRVVVEFAGQVGSVSSATFDPSSQYVMTTSGFYGAEGALTPFGANEVRVWDVKTGNFFYTFRDAGTPMILGAFGADGKSMLAIDTSGRVFSYYCDLCVEQDELLHLAQKRSVRQLTPDERARYLREAPKD